MMWYTAPKALEHGAKGFLGLGRQLPVLALLFLVALQEGAGELLGAEGALGGQLAHGFLHGQVAAAQALADLAAAVGARGLFLLEPRVRQEVDETAGAHQVPVGALGGEIKHQPRAGGETESREGNLDALEAEKDALPTKSTRRVAKAAGKGDGAHPECLPVRGIAPKKGEKSPPRTRSVGLPRPEWTTHIPKIAGFKGKNQF